MHSDIRRHQASRAGHRVRRPRHALAEYDYPTTTAELLDIHGEHELDIPNGARTFREVLGPLDDSENDTEPAVVVYESHEEVRQMIFNAIGSEAVGREEYTDRELETRQEARRRGEESF